MNLLSAHRRSFRGGLFGKSGVVAVMSRTLEDPIDKHNMHPMRTTIAHYPFFYH